MRAARLVPAVGTALLAATAAVGVALALVAALALAPFSRPFVASRMVGFLDAAIAGRLKLDGVAVLSRGGIELHGLQVFDPDGHLVLSVGKARVFADITGLRNRAIGLTVELDAPSILLEEEEGGGVSIARAFAPAHPSAPGKPEREGGPGWTLHVSRLAIRDGDVWWVDAAGETRFEASDLAVDARGLFAPRRTLVDLRLRGSLATPVEAPLALDVVGGITDGVARLPVLHAQIGGTAVSAVGQADLPRATGRVAITRLGLDRSVTRKLVPNAPAGDDLSAAAYAEADGKVVTAAIRAEPSAPGAAGLADAAVAVRMADPAAAVGFDVAVDRLDPSRLASVAPAGEVTLSGHGALAGRSLADLRGRVAVVVQRSRLRRGEVTRAEIVARADRGTIDVTKATIAAPGLSADASLRWREGADVAGKLGANVSDLRAALENAGALLGRPMPPLAGRGRLGLTVGGTSAAPAFGATLDAPLLRHGGLAVADAKLTGSATGPLRTASAHVDGTAGSIRSGGRDVARAVLLRGTLAEEAGSILVTAALPGFRDPATLDARGRLGPGRRTLLLSDLTFAYPGTRWALAAPATVVLAGPSVDRLALAAGAQRIVASGGLGKKGALDATAELEKVDLARLPAGILPADEGIAGLVSGRVRAGGTTAKPDVAADLAIDGGAFRTLHGFSAVAKASWQGAARRASGTISAARDGGGTVDVAADLPLPLGSRPSEPVHATVRATGLAVEDLVAAAGSDALVGGVVSLDAALEGSAGAPSLRGSATLVDGVYEELDGVGLALSLEDAGERGRGSLRVSLEGRDVASADVEAPLDAADLLARPARAIAALRAARLDGTASLLGLDLALLAGRAGVPEGIAGIVRGHAAFTGSIAAPRAQATLEVSAGAFDGYRGLGGRVDLAAKDDGLSATGRLTLVDEEAARFEASLGVPPERLGTRGALAAAPLRADVSVPKLALERAATQELPLTGSVTARLTVAGTPRAPEVTLTASGEGVAVEGRPLGAVRLAGRYATGRATAEGEIRPATGGALHTTLALDVRIGLGASGGPIGQAPAEVTAKADALDLGFVPAVLPSVVRSAGGKLVLDVRAKGPLARLSPRGELHVADGHVAIAEYGEWKGIAIDASVTDDGFEVSRLDVRRGKAGKLSGTASLRGLRGDRARLAAHLSADSFTIARAGMDVATVELTADATGTYGGRTLAMDVTVPKGVIRLPKRTPRELQTLEQRKDIVIGKRPEKKRTRPHAAPPPTPAAAQEPAPLTVTAHLVVPRNLFVKGDDPKIDVELKADVKYERVGSEDYAEGSIESIRGVVEPIGGRVFDVQRGRVQFTGGPPSAALLDVEAKYTNPAAVVTVNVQGPVTKPEIKLTSQPPMEEGQIAMLIATGRTELKAGSGAVGTLTGSEAGKAALGAIATQAFKNLVADKLPLDTVAIESGALRAGKYVTDKIYVGYTRRFDANPERGENVDEARVEYQITPRWTFESRYGTSQTGGASLIWSKDY